MKLQIDSLTIDLELSGTGFKWSQGGNSFELTWREQPKGYDMVIWKNGEYEKEDYMDVSSPEQLAQLSLDFISDYYGLEARCDSELAGKVNSRRKLTRKYDIMGDIDDTYTDQEGFGDRITWDEYQDDNPAHNTSFWG